jgi:hypothetical protein
VICLLPSVFGIVSLHPYEYIYYNSFVGGVSGAEGRFETDYWAISFREAAEYVNENASPNATFGWRDLTQIVCIVCCAKI